jgi:hypothetical protein
MTGVTPPPQTPVPRSRTRRLIAGLLLFWLGIAVGAWTLGTSALAMAVGFAAAFAGFGLMISAGALTEGVPTTPVTLFRESRAAGLPPTVTVALGFGLLATGMAGLVLRALVLGL